MTGPDHGAIGEPIQQPIQQRIQQRIEEVDRWKAWAAQLLTRAPQHGDARPEGFDGVVSPMANIVTGKAPPTPPSGYDPRAPDELLRQLDLQVAFCRERASQLRALVGPDASERMLTPVADLAGEGA